MGGGVSHACGQWSGCGQIPIFLGEGTKKISVPNDQQCRIFIKKENLLESSAADNTVASSGLIFFSYCGAFSSL